MSDRVWDKISPHLPGKKGDWGGIAKNSRLFVDAVMWVHRTGAPWRDLPPSYGGWSNTHRRFIRWRDKGRWENLLLALVDEPDYEWLIIDATHSKAHFHATGAVGGNEATGRTKGGSTQKHIFPWMPMLCRCGSLSLTLPRLIVRRLKTLLTA